jgi:peptidoglycan hydrolase-like protein with peptidoglycan-binding domain
MAVGPAQPAPAAQAAPAPAAGGQLTPTQLEQVQRVLAQQGFGPLAIDGVLGDATRNAIRRFEKSRGMAERGEITPQFLKALSAMSGVALPRL